MVNLSTSGRVGARAVRHTASETGFHGGPGDIESKVEPTTALRKCPSRPPCACRFMAQIQQASQTNIAEIVSLVNDAFQVETDFRTGDRTSADEVAQLMHGGRFLIALHDQQVAGVVFVRINGSMGYFGMLAVRPRLQRLGLGRTLIEAAEDYCRSRGCTRMTLSTSSVRRELLDRYGKLGYRITSVEPVSPEGPFTKPIEIVKMAKEI